MRLWGGGGAEGLARCRRSVAHSAQKKFLPSFFSHRRGSRGIFVLCTASSRCMRIDAAERHVVQYQLLFKNGR